MKKNMNDFDGKSFDSMKYNLLNQLHNYWKDETERKWNRITYDFQEGLKISWLLDFIPLWN